MGKHRHRNAVRSEAWGHPRLLEELGFVEFLTKEASPVFGRRRTGHWRKKYQSGWWVDYWPETSRWFLYRPNRHAARGGHQKSPRLLMDLIERSVTFMCDLTECIQEEPYRAVVCVFEKDEFGHPRQIVNGDLTGRVVRGPVANGLEFRTLGGHGTGWLFDNGMMFTEKDPRTFDLTKPEYGVEFGPMWKDPRAAR